MKTTELMLGNIVRYDDLICKITAIMPNHINLRSNTDLDIVCTVREVHPVEVDTDMLVKAGWGERVVLDQFNMPTNIRKYYKWCDAWSVTYEQGVADIFMSTLDKVVKPIDQVHLLQQMLMQFGLDEVAESIMETYMTSIDDTEAEAKAR